MRITTVSSGLISAQALTSGASSAASAEPNGSCQPSASPPPAAAALTTNARRFIFGTKFMASSRLLRVCRSVNAGAHLLVGAAAAYIGDRRVDVGIGRL